MAARARSYGPDRTRRRRAVAVGALALVLGLAAPAPAVSASQAGPGRDAADQPFTVDDFTMVQANIYTGLKTERFQKDVRKVLSLQPDFITYNEVPFRTDGVMAPEGYDIHRSMKNRFTAATPVAWRSDRWTAIDTGVHRISNWRGRPPGKLIELGRRFANWATVRSADGRVVSVVSAHVAPPTRGMPDLLDRSVKRLDRLVGRLAARGPVLVGGDFNVHYKSGRYPRTMLTAAGLSPTFDYFGTYFPTGDHFGHTIDYVFTRAEEQLVPVAQYPVELRSDHDAVVVDYGWVTDAPEATSMVRNQPSGGPSERRAALRALHVAIAGAQPGTTIALRTRTMGLKAPRKFLRRALDRGVHLQVVTANADPTRSERRLARAIEQSGDARSTMVACGAGCVPVWRGAGMPATMLMLSDVDGSWISRYDASRWLTSDLVDRQSWVRIATGPVALREGAALLTTGG